MANETLKGNAEKCAEFSLSPLPTPALESAKIDFTRSAASVTNPLSREAGEGRIPSHRFYRT